MATRQVVQWEPNAPESKQALKEWKQITSVRRKLRAYFDADIPASVAERVRSQLGWDVLSGVVPIFETNG